MRILILDNFDSFTYNLYQYVGEILKNDDQPFQLDVVRNNNLSLRKIKKRKYNKIIISPGPGSPDNPKYFGVCGEVIKKLGKSTPILGVCLGMQGIAHFFGGQIVCAKVPMHGKTSTIYHNNKGIFKDLPKNLEVMRYHSLIVNPKKFPKELIVTARAEREIMGLQHKKYPIFGIQFHPESFATEGGKQILKNFLFFSS